MGFLLPGRRLDFAVVLATLGLACTLYYSPFFDGTGANALDDTSDAMSYDDAVESAKLTASDAATDDRFGWSVAVDGDRAVVTAKPRDQNWSHSGWVYVFERDDGTGNGWNEVARLDTPDATSDDDFGWSVSISGDLVVVGADGDNENGTSSGAAYVFERNEGGEDNWGRVAKLVPADATAGDRFGHSVAVDEETIVAGALDNNGNGSGGGAAYVFERHEGGTDNWGQVAKLLASDGAGGDGLGRSISIDGDVVAVGSSRDHENGYNSGAVYIFERHEGGRDNWGQTGKLLPSGGGDDDRFAWSVSVSEDVLIAAARGDDDNGDWAGAAYIFERHEGGTDNWGEAAKLLASDGESDNLFGISVSLHRDLAVVGARFDDENGPDAGAAYLFGRNRGGAGNWGEMTKLLASDGAAGDRFGDSVAIGGETAFVGARGDADNGHASGSAYVFDLPESSTD